jgi:hypothetical protein
MDIGKLTVQDNLPLSKAMVLCALPHPKNKKIIKIRGRRLARLFLILKERAFRTALDIFDTWKRRPL